MEFSRSEHYLKCANPSGPEALRSQGQDAKMREHMVGLGITVDRGAEPCRLGGLEQSLCSLRSNGANRRGSAFQSGRPGEHNEVQTGELRRSCR